MNVPGKDTHCIRLFFSGPTCACVFGDPRYFTLVVNHRDSRPDLRKRDEVDAHGDGGLRGADGRQKKAGRNVGISDLFVRRAVGRRSGLAAKAWWWTEWMW